MLGVKVKHKKRRLKQLKEPVSQPLDNLWHKAVSKNKAEQEEGRDGLELLFILFEDTLDLKTLSQEDPLSDLTWPEIQSTELIEEFAKPRGLAAFKKKEAASVR